MIEDYVMYCGISKGRMLEIANILSRGEVKDWRWQKNIIRLMAKLYESAEDELIIKMLPYEVYLCLKQLCEQTNKVQEGDIYILNNEELDLFPLIKHPMIVEERRCSPDGPDSYAKFHTIQVSLFHRLERLITPEYEELSKKYDELGKVMRGVFYTYGVIEYNFFFNLVQLYYCEEMDEEEMESFFNSRIDFFDDKVIIEDQGFKFIVYSERILKTCYSRIIKDQLAMGLNYKLFEIQKILNRTVSGAIDEYRDFVMIANECMRHNLPSIRIPCLLGDSARGEDVLEEFFKYSHFNNEHELEQFIDLLKKAEYTASKYELCGYSNKELVEIF